MSFFGKIGKAIGGAVKGVAKVVGKVAKVAAPALGGIAGVLGVPLISKIAKPIGKALGVVAGSSQQGSAAVGGLLENTVQSAVEVKDLIAQQTRDIVSAVAGAAGSKTTEVIVQSAKGDPLQQVIDKNASARASLPWILTALGVAVAGVFGLVVFGSSHRRR